MQLYPLDVGEQNNNFPCKELGWKIEFCHFFFIHFRIKEKGLGLGGKNKVSRGIIEFFCSGPYVENDYECA